MCGASARKAPGAENPSGQIDMKKMPDHSGMKM